MGNVLSQDEVDSLLEGIGDGKVETESDTVEADDTPPRFDFNTQAGPVHLRLPALGIINERLVGYLRDSFLAVTRTGVEVTFARMESVKFGEFCRGLPLPASLNVFKINPLRGYALLGFDGQLVFAFVDSFFGGKGVSHVKLEGRGFTNIEMKIIHKIVEIVLTDLQRAWADYHTVEMRYERSEMDPQFTPIVSPNDIVIAIRFRLDLLHAAGNMTLCIPFSTLESVRDKLQSRYQRGHFEADLRWRRYIEKKILETSVSLRCTLGTAEIKTRDLRHLKVGDVIRLDQRIEAPVDVLVERVPKFRGYLGKHNNKRAIRLELKIPGS
jgi:flagellar motor switch protein FliM